MGRNSDELDGEVARKVFGWKNIHDHENGAYGKKQDRLGRWRTAKVPNYSTDPIAAYQIDERMKQLGIYKRYTSELEKLTRAKGVPSDWASPEQRCRAALKAVGSGKALRLIKK